MSASPTSLSACFLRLGQLPQCEAVFLEGPVQGASFVNLLTGQLVGRQMSPVEEGREDLPREVTGLLLSCLPFVDANDGRRTNVSLGLEGARKLVYAWEKQAVGLGLK